MRGTTGVLFWMGASLLILLVMMPRLALAQDPAPNATASENKSDFESPLSRGANEFGIWSGFSPFSFRFEGQTENRKLFLLNLQYARTLFSTTPITLKYTAEIVPVALQSRPVEVYLVNNNNVVTQQVRFMARREPGWIPGECWSKVRPAFCQWQRGVFVFQPAGSNCRLLAIQLHSDGWFRSAILPVIGPYLHRGLEVSPFVE